MDPNTKSNKVFNIPELLDLILQHLPPQALLIMQGVCRTWHSHIQHSTPLQEMLYFRQRPWNPNRPEEKPTINPFLLTHGSRIFLQTTMTGDYYIYFSLHGGDIRNFSWDLANAREHESWKRMYATDLPCQVSLDLIGDVEIVDPDGVPKHVVDYEGGSVDLGRYMEGTTLGAIMAQLWEDKEAMEREFERL